MARKPRLHLPGGLYHVMLRGNDRQAIFIDDGDRLRLEMLLIDGIKRYRHRIHAFCFMHNHIHLALQVDTIPLSRIMHNLGFRYTAYYNWRHHHVGHVFQGRFKAILVDADPYLLELVRYIHLNPVRAGLLRDPAGYAWSGHRAYLGLESRRWLHCDWVLSQFGKDLAAARTAYMRFLSMPAVQQSQQDFKRATQADGVIGDELFARKSISTALSAAAPAAFAIADVCDAVCHAAGIAHDTLHSRARSVAQKQAHQAAAWIVDEHENGRLSELARYLQRDPSTLSRAAAALRRADGEDPARLLALRAVNILTNKS